jgi:hypothetical protein
MTFARHPDFQIQRLTIGTERAPLLVIDNVIADAEELVRIAASKPYGDVTSYYPGVRSKEPLLYQQNLLNDLRHEFAQAFGLNARALRFTGCHFSLVTTPPEKLIYLQRIPHIDSFEGHELAFVHYLFKADLGGTAFYRHRSTGYEYIDRQREADYLRALEAEQAAVERSSTGYIDGDTEFYEKVGEQQGVFNRMLVYRRNSLHSGAIKPGFVPNLDPRQGRLSVNGFIA